MKIAIIVIIAAILLSSLRIVPQATAYVIEFLGSYKTTWGNGLHFKIPLLERVAKKVILKEQMADFPPQPVITKDNVTMQIDTIVYFKVVNPQLYTYGVVNPISAIENLTATTLRNIIGELELDETLTSRDRINSKMLAVIDEATDPWGIKINRVEVKNIMPPKDIQEAMEKQMRAEREKRQTILEAEAHQQSVVLRAEGDKKEAILHAEADREAAIARAQGEAEAIRLKYEAEAAGLERLSSVGVSNAVLTIKQLDALTALGDGRATKLVVPTGLTESASTLAYMGDILGLGDKADASPKKGPAAASPDVCCSDAEKSRETHNMAGKRN